MDDHATGTEPPGTAPGALFRASEGGAVECFACAHRCRIPEGKTGICGVRRNVAGVLRVPSGWVGSLQADPIEKKPFFHFLPGSIALSFGMFGCNFHCPFCQNWEISQDPQGDAGASAGRRITPDGIVDAARRANARSIVSTYNEPLVTAEWAAEIFRAAKAANLSTGFVSNGYATPEALDFLRPVLDAFKVDLKSMREETYRGMGGRLSAVLESIRGIHARGFWLEVVTLLVPGMNDSEAEIREAARFLASVSPDVPWHVTAFHPDHRMSEAAATTPSALARAAEIGAGEGLRYVYAGNRPGETASWEDTRCPGCRKTLVRRRGFRILENRIGTAGACPDCAAPVAGRWT